MKNFYKIVIFTVLVWFWINSSYADYPLFFPMWNFTNNSYGSENKPFGTSKTIDFWSQSSIWFGNINEQLFNIIDNDWKYGWEWYNYDTKDTRFKLFEAIYNFKNNEISIKKYKDDYFIKKWEKLKKELEISKLRYDNIDDAKKDEEKYNLWIDKYFSSYYEYLDFLKDWYENNTYFSFEQKFTNLKWVKVNLNNINIISKNLTDNYNDKFKKIYLLWVDINGSFAWPFMKGGWDMIYIENEKDLDKITNLKEYLITEWFKNSDGSFSLKNINSDINNYSLYILWITNNDKIMLIENIDNNAYNSRNIWYKKFFDNIEYNDNYLSKSFINSINKYLSKIRYESNLSTKSKKLIELKNISNKLDSKIILIQNELFNKKDEKNLTNTFLTYNKLVFLKNKISELLNEKK
jgi:hypothetical protein